MKICVECKDKRGVLGSIFRDSGKCELCGKESICYDIDESFIPTVENFKELKDTYNSGGFIVVAKWEHKSNLWYKQMIENPFENDHLYNATSIVLILKEHEHILDAYLKDSSVEIEVCQRKISSKYFEENDLIGNYHHSNDYQLKKTNFEKSCEDLDKTIEKFDSEENHETLADKYDVKDICEKYDLNRMLKPINLNGCWCEATQEHYDKLIDMGLKAHNTAMNLESIEVLFTDGIDVFYGNVSIGNFMSIRKQIKLNSNKEWEYVGESNEKRINKKEENEVVETEKDVAEVEDVSQTSPVNFGFEHKEGVEILKVCKDFNSMFGIVYDKSENNRPKMVEWDLNGFGKFGQSWINLTPLKPKWYEVEENFPKAFMDIINNRIKVCQTKHQYDNLYFDERYHRPATEQEIMSLLVKKE